MNREIKFRAWDKVNGMFRRQEMIGEPTISKSDLSKGHIVFVNDIFKDEEFIWMQYTGLKDPHGVEIYDGTIMWDEHNEFYGVVKYYDGKFNYVWDNIVEDLFEVHDTLTVAGNIHENPELLK